MMKKLLKKSMLLAVLLSSGLSFAQTWNVTQVPSTVTTLGGPITSASPNEYVVVGTNIPVGTTLGTNQLFALLKKNDGTTVGNIGILLTPNADNAVDPVLSFTRGVISQSSVRNADATPTDYSDDTFTHTFNFSSFNTWGQLDYGIPASVLLDSNSVALTVESAPAEIIHITGVGTPPNEIERGREFTVNYKYKSNVAITSMKINLWVISNGPYKDKFLAATDAIVNLPSTGGAEVDASAKIRFPVSPTIDNVSGGTTTTFTLNNPPVASPAGTSIFYQLRFRLVDAANVVTGQKFSAGNSLSVDKVQNSIGNVTIVGAGGFVENDADDDGVVNASDTCPGTAYPSTVDANGCVITLCTTVGTQPTRCNGARGNSTG